MAELPEPAKKGLKIYPHKHIDEIVKILFKMPKVAGQAKDENAAKVGELAEPSETKNADAKVVKTAAKPVAKKPAKKSTKNA